MSRKQKIIITEAEKAYRTKYYHFFQVVSKRPILCTSCGNELNSTSKFLFGHPVLEILQCKTCLDKYQDTNFKSDKSKCLICCSSSVYSCSNKSCPYEFCRKCIKRNVNKCIREAEKDDWKCFVCNVKPFWELRGICAAIMALPNKRQSMRNKEKINSPYQQKKMRKSERTIKRLNKICDVSSGDSSDDDNDNNVRPLYKANRRKLYSSIKENIEITPVEIHTEDDDEKDEKKQATLKFQKSFTVHFNNLRKSLAKISTALDICEEQCRNTTFTSKNDALDITKRLESILMETETLSIENSKEINKTYQSWSRNYSSHFKERNGYKKRRVKNSSTNDDDEEKNGTEEEPIEKKRILEITNNEVPSDCDSDEIFSGNDKTNSMEKNSPLGRKSNESDNKSRKKKLTSTESENIEKSILQNRNNSSTDDFSSSKSKNETKKSKMANLKSTIGSDSKKNSPIEDSDSRRDSENDCLHSMSRISNESADGAENVEERAKQKLLESSSSEEIAKQTLQSTDNSDTDDEKSKKNNEETRTKNKSASKREIREKVEKVSEMEKCQSVKLPQINDSTEKIDSDSEKRNSVIDLGEKINETSVKNSEEKAKKKLLQSSDDSDSEKDTVAESAEKIDETSVKKSKEKEKNKFLQSSDDSDSEKDTVAESAEKIDETSVKKSKEKEKNKFLQSSDDLDSEKDTVAESAEKIDETSVKKSKEKEKNKFLQSSDDSDSEKDTVAESAEKIDETSVENSEEKAKKKLLQSSDDSDSEKDTVAESVEKIDETPSNEEQSTEEKAKRKILETSDDSDTGKERNSLQIDKSTAGEINHPQCDENNSEENAKRKLLQSSDESEESTQKLQKKKVESSTESSQENEKTKTKISKELEAKKKLLESSDSTSERDIPTVKNIPKEAENSEQVAKNKLLESSDDSVNEKNQSKERNSEDETKKKLLLSNSDLSSIDDESINEGRSVSENSSSLSSTDDKSRDLFNSFEVETVKRKRKNSEDNNSSESCRMRRKKKFKISRNSYYRADEKLRMACSVELKRLSRKVLRNHARALKKSKQHLEREKHKSLMSMDNMEKIRKRNKFASSSGNDDNDSESKSNSRSRKKIDEKDDTLMDHLKKVENGEIDKKQESMKSSDDESSNERPKKITTKQDLFNAAEERAKNLLLCSSGSDVEMPPEVFDETENAEEENKNKKNKDKTKESKKKEKIEEEKSEKSNSDDSSVNEEEATKQTAKDKWKNDKLLRVRISDSDSEVEKAKYEKRKQKMDEKKKDDSSSNEKESKMKKKKKRVKRKILDSDSDIEILSDSESSSSKASQSKEETKKSRKRGARKSSDSDDSLMEKKPKTKRKRIKPVSDSGSDSETLNNSQSSPIKGGRKNIRKVLKDKQVADDTKQAAKEEEERLKRIAERQKVYNEMYEIRLAGEEKVDKLVLDFDEETKKELISVDPGLVKRLKPHQAKGIKFMWDACFESVSRVNSSKGSGCIIAHCMGLGKTFQVVTLVHTLLSNKETGVNNVMVVCPLSTALNWAGEFEMWLKDLNNYDDIEVIELGKYKQNFERKYQLEYWKKNGGVLIIGYDMFRTLTSTGKRMKKSMQTSFLQCLVDPGPDVIVCDEGHLLKNEDTALSKAMRKVKTLRRIVLTGTPLQNNLIEYHCMVQFVKPNLLGTKKEFSNRFVNPIKNGSTADSTPYDVKLMKKRAFILHNLLEGSVQRFDYSVLTPFLPPKQEYVISVKLSPLQVELYQYYLDNFTRGGSARGPKLFADYHALQRICTHPIVMRMNAEKMEKKRLEEETDSEGSLKDFIDDGSDSSASSSDNDGSDVQCVDSDKEVPVPRRGTRANPVDNPVVEGEIETIEPREWWSGMIKPEHFDDMRVSAKLVLLFGILKESEKLGDKVLVFSQSLYSLTLIEDFLSRIDDAAQNNTESENLENHSGSWSLGLDYFRLDGQTSADNRSQWCKIFNRPTNTRARLFLISTRAGGLGINLTAANRVIIFDASWNPSHDVQSIFRIYRFGQKKPCYIYRFLSKGTMEEKIYNRQVSKLSLACRVIDEQQIERHFNSSDLAEMYTFDPNPPRDSQTLNLPKDRLLAEIFLKYKDLVHNYHEHDSLLENQLDEVLDEEERKLAWQEYEDEKKGKPVVQFNHVNPFGLNPMNVNMFPNQGHLVSEVDRMIPLLRKDYPTRTDEELRQMAQSTVLNMYSSILERQAMQRTQQNQFIQQPYAMPQYIQQQQYQYQQQQQILRNMQRQQQLKQQQQQQQQLSKMASAGRPAGRPTVIDISSPNGKEE